MATTRQPQSDETQAASDLLLSLPPSQRVDQTKALLDSLPSEDQKKVATSVLAGPTDKVRDWIWLIAVAAFAIVLVGSFITLAISVFVTVPGGTSAQLILTVFTSVVGFLAGLFAPSPVSNQ